jgi:metal-dependent hydrolase (beta-lactamase superfamily II)
LLIDCGRGITLRMVQAGIKLGAVNKRFITHLHSDHVVGIPDLWFTGWPEIPCAQRTFRCLPRNVSTRIQKSQFVSSRVGATEN